MAGMGATCPGFSRSLRFDAIEKEEAYVRARAYALRHTIMLTTPIGFSFLVVAVLSSLSDAIWQETASDTVLKYKVLWCGSLSCNALILAGLFLATWRRWLGSHGLENVAVIELSLLAISLPIITKAFLSRLLGSSTEELLGKSFPNVETVFLLFMDLLVTAAHITPIRWFKLVPFAGAAILVYGMAVHLICDMQARGVPILGFAALVLFSSAGKRSVELQERQNFTMVLAEKEKRFEAEHLLTQGEQRSTAVCQDQDQTSVKEGSMHESLVTTTAASEAFKLDRDPLPSSMARLLEIGEQEQWLLPNSALRLLPNTLLGRGGFGMVVQGDYNGSEVAVKAPRHGALDRASDIRQICNELRVLRRLRHPNIVTLYGACLDTNNADLALVLELLRGETLLKYITKRKATSEVRLQLLDDIAAALVYLHGRTPPIIHGDLKGDNVFVEFVWGRLGSCRAKLLDFGLSLLRTKHARTRGGTLHWMAPELLRTPAKAPERTTDVYAAGCLIYFVVTGTPPHYSISDRQLKVSARVCQPLPALTWAQAPLVMSHRPLAESCCDQNPLRRPAIQDVSTSLSGAKRQALGSARLTTQVQTALHQALEEARQRMMHQDVQVMGHGGTRPRSPAKMRRNSPVSTHLSPNDSTTPNPPSCMKLLRNDASEVEVGSI